MNAHSATRPSYLSGPSGTMLRAAEWQGGADATPVMGAGQPPQIELCAANNFGRRGHQFLMSPRGISAFSLRGGQSAGLVQPRKSNIEQRCTPSIATDVLLLSLCVRKSKRAAWSRPRSKPTAVECRRGWDPVDLARARRELKGEQQREQRGAGDTLWLAEPTGSATYNRTMPAHRPLPRPARPSPTSSHRVLNFSTRTSQILYVPAMGSPDAYVINRATIYLPQPESSIFLPLLSTS